MVPGLERSVPQPLVDGEYGVAVVQQHARSPDAYLCLVHHAAAGEGPGPVARHARRRLHPPLAPLHDVPVVRGEHNDPAGTSRPLQQRTQMLHRVSGPIGTARVGAVQRIVDGVQHAGDDCGAGDIVNGRADLVCQRVPARAAVQGQFVEQPRGHPMALGERVQTGSLDLLLAYGQFATEEARPANPGQRGKDGERDAPPVMPFGKALQPGVVPADHIVDDLGGHRLAHPVGEDDQHRISLGQRQHRGREQALQVHGAGRRGRGPTLVSGQGLTEGNVVGGATQPDRAEHRAQALCQRLVVHAGPGIRGGPVDPGILVAVPGNQRPDVDRCGYGLAEPAHQAHRGQRPGYTYLVAVIVRARAPRP